MKLIIKVLVFLLFTLIPGYFFYTDILYSNQIDIRYGFNLFYKKPNSVNNMVLTLNGKSIPDNMAVQFLIITIDNNHKDINTGSFDTSNPFGFIINNATIITKPQIIDAKSNSIDNSYILFKTNSNKFYFKPFILNKNNSFSIKLFVMHNRNSIITIKHLGNISGISNINLIDSSIPLLQKSIISTYQLIAFISYILLLLFIVYILFTHKKFKRYINIISILHKNTDRNIKSIIIDHYLSNNYHSIHNLQIVLSNSELLSAYLNAYSLSYIKYNSKYSKQFKSLNTNDYNFIRSIIQKMRKEKKIILKKGYPTLINNDIGEFIDKLIKCG